MRTVRQWRIWLSEEVEHVVVRAAHEHHPVEIGGVLVGVSVRRRPWATAAAVVPSRCQTPTYYTLPQGARHVAVEAARKHDRRIGYVGDWHAHPADIGPSETDLATMRRLAADVDAGCPRPVLLIARRVGHEYRLDVWQFTGHTLRPLRVLAAGALSEAMIPKPTRRRPIRSRRRRR